ncbi:hypothetical protein ACGFX4_07635 [Kitasatospora sp. NPDC048365]|uniref:hypothetical protein n=1 Tax=Kitasatospora sp. NPDC048365 TaxID=3364050 RepID=UPI0037232C52
MGRGRSPQEKKQLSYAKDRRNFYGENDKSSRRNIRRSKQAVNSANRRLARTVLVTATGPLGPDDTSADAVEQDLLRRRPKTWRKCPDTPLGPAVIRALGRRARLGIDEPERAEQRIRRVRVRLRGPARSAPDGL